MGERERERKRKREKERKRERERERERVRGRQRGTKRVTRPILSKEQKVKQNCSNERIYIQKFN